MVRSTSGKGRKHHNRQTSILPPFILGDLLNLIDDTSVDQGGVHFGDMAENR
jgi:hypothetical protein